jgi:zinc and cadmium transporter
VGGRPDVGGAHGAVVGYFALERALHLAPHAMTMAAASFLYVAIGDLIPMLHEQKSRHAGPGQAALIVAGIVTSAILHRHG